MNLKIVNWTVNFFDFIFDDQKSVGFSKSIKIVHEWPILLDELG